MLAVLLACSPDPPAEPCVPISHWEDWDADGYGAGEPSSSCRVPKGRATNDLDCADADPAVHPGSDEHCNRADEDCDGEIDDDAVDALELWADEDLDGFGDPDVPILRCTQGEDQSLVRGDCDDDDFTVNPDRDELCNGVDDDCDGLLDDADDSLDDDRTTAWRDADGDGHGDPDVRTSACVVSAGWVTTFDDCDDADPSAFPGGAEVCGGGDEDCDGLVDGHDPDAPGAAPGWFADRDGDGLGDPSAPSACTTAGSVQDASDCDDADPDTLADGRWRADLDGDGVGAGPIVLGDGCAPPAGPFASVAAGEDCDDVDPARYPGADDACGEGIDQDCDGHDDPCGAQGGGSLALAGAIFRGEPGDEAGYALAGSGDLDLDGRPDLLVGAPASDRGASDGGAVWLVNAPGPGETVLSASVVLTGRWAGKEVGTQLLVVDLDRDGTDDALLTASADDYWVRGPVLESRELTQADVWITGASADLAVAGDQDGDGDPEILAARYGGELVVVPGGEGPQRLNDLDVAFEVATTGFAVEAGDVDGDGVLDALVGSTSADGAFTDTGGVHLLLGPILGPGIVPDAFLAGSDPFDAAAIPGLGDLDGDGRAELVVGARAEVYVSGLPAGDGLLLDADGLVVASDADLRLALPGDLDGDSAGELALGVIPYPGDAGAGAVRVLHGPIAGTVAIGDAIRWTGEADGDAAGTVAGVGDLDGNGLPDLLAGATGWNGGAGAAYVLYSDPEGAP